MFVLTLLREFYLKLISSKYLKKLNQIFNYRISKNISQSNFTIILYYNNIKTINNLFGALLINCLLVFQSQV